MQQAARVSDWTAFLYEGVLIEFGHTKQVFTKTRAKGNRGLHYGGVSVNGCGAASSEHPQS